MLHSYLILIYINIYSLVEASENNNLKFRSPSIYTMKTSHYWQIVPKYTEKYEIGYLLKTKMITIYSLT